MVKRGGCGVNWKCDACSGFLRRMWQEPFSAPRLAYFGGFVLNDSRVPCWPLFVMVTKLRIATRFDRGVSRAREMKLIRATATMTLPSWKSRRVE